MTVPLAWRLTTGDRGRLAVASLGIGCAVALMILLFATFEGVRAEAAGYVSGRPVDAWLGQRGATNLFRTSSLLPTDLADRIVEVPGVGEVAPLARLIATTELQDEEVTLFVFGFDPASRLGRPDLVQGRAGLRRGEMILDRAFAAKHALGLGDRLTIHDRTFRVVALSRGTNAFLIQYAFVPIGDAHELMGTNQDLASFFMITAGPGVEPERMIDDLRDALPRLAVHDHPSFVEANLDELRTGILPVLGSVAFAGGLLALAVLTLTLYGSVLDKRESYALLKAMGARRRTLILLVLRQGLVTAAFGFVTGLLLYLVGAPVLMRLVPEMAQAPTWPILLGVLAATLGTAVLGAWLPIVRLTRIYPAEAFRA